MRRHRQPSGFECPQLGHLPQRVVAHHQELARRLGEDPSDFGQGHVVHVPGEQRRADFFLEAPDALTDRRLSAVHPLRGARERTFIDNRKKVFEVQQVHGEAPEREHSSTAACLLA